MASETFWFECRVGPRYGTGVPLLSKNSEGPVVLMPTYNCKSSFVIQHLLTRVRTMVDFELLCRRLIGSRCSSREGFSSSSSFITFDRVHSVQGGRIDMRSSLQSPHRRINSVRS